MFMWLIVTPEGGILACGNFHVGGVAAIRRGVCTGAVGCGEGASGAFPEGGFSSGVFNKVPGPRLGQKGIWKYPPMPCKPWGAMTCRT